MKTRIAYLIGDLDKGGQERQLYYLLKEIDPGIYKVRVYVWDFSKDNYYYRKLPRHIEVIGYKEKRNSFYKLIQFCLSIILFRPSIIHSYASYLNRVAHFGTRLPFVKAVSIGALRSSFKFMLKKFPLSMMKQNFFKPNAIHVNSVKSANELRKFCAENNVSQKIFVISNGLDTTKFAPSWRHADLSKTIKTLSVGRMIDTKEYPDQLRLVRSLLDSGFSIEHTIVGYGQEEGAIRQEIHKLNLTENITIENSADDVAPFYQVADLFIQTSSTEGLPNCVMEAMSCGLCCLATNVGDTRMLIDDKVNGFLFSINDIDSMKQTILELWKPGNEEKFSEFGKKAHEKVHSLFSLKSSYQQITSMYNSI